MALPLTPADFISPLLLVKALFAWLAFFLFLYYRHHWERAKAGLDVRHFFTKWRAVRHAYFLGYASLGFAIGFSLELVGVPLGMSPSGARIISSVLESSSLLCMLYVFFSLALEDVPHFQRVADGGRRPEQEQIPPLLRQKPKKTPAKKISRKR